MDIYTHLTLVLLHLAALFTNSDIHAEHINGQHIPEPSTATQLTGHDIPVLKMLRRQIRHFRQGARASITLVFHATEPVLVRWFCLDDKYGASSSELRNMLPVEGDPRFEISTIKSGDVVATVLIIHKFMQVFPQIFDTILTLKSWTMQYQISTEVHKSRDYGLEVIDSPEWLIIPPPHRLFMYNKPLTVRCEIFVPHEKDIFTNELFLIRAVQHADESPPMTYHRQVTIHKDTYQHLVEEDNILGAILQGRRHPRTKWGHVRYEVQMDTLNATAAFQGVYQCGFERQHDKVFVTSRVMAQDSLQHKEKPKVIVQPCDPKDYVDPGADKDSRGFFKLEEDRVSCLRCRSYGFPYANVGLFRGNFEVHDSYDISVTKSVNVAAAGVSEATYTFRNPKSDLTGEVYCRAVNVHGSDREYFNILFQPRSL